MNVWLLSYFFRALELTFLLPLTVWWAEQPGLESESIEEGKTFVDNNSPAERRRQAFPLRQALRQF